MKELLKKFIPVFLLNWYHFLLAFLGAVFYGFPSQKIKVIGVTGTDGKSTVVSLITKILEEASFKVAAISSIKFKIGDKEWQNTLKMTMPGRFKIQRFLREAVNAKCQYAVLEVTDEGIKQYRHRYIDFQVAVLTNITPEHIEAHGSFEKMRAMNGKLFQITKNSHIINLDDENAEYFLSFSADKKINYQIKEDQILINGNPTPLNLKLLGKFNLYNAAAAICVGLSQGIDLETCKRAVEKTEGAPGRMEVVVSQPFTAIVDYAHTVNALVNVYQTIIGLKTRGSDTKMICVFGSCGGGRDKWKRPVFGEIAAKYCDEIILTNEDPYDENPSQILSDIKSGISKSQFPTPNFYEIINRREAIRKSLELAKPGDIVIITGKGCEPWICVARGKKIPWDDRRVVREEFNQLQ